MIPKFCVVQISDIHMGKHLADLPMRLQKAFGAVFQNLEHDLQTLICVFSGDIAFSGKNDQYAEFETELVRIEIELQKRNLSYHFIFAPGNHDCDFESPSSAVRDLLVRTAAHSLNKSKADASIISQFLSVQSNFRHFASKWKCFVDDASLVTVIDQPKLKIRVNLINTAWCCQKDDKPGLPFIIDELNKIEYKSEYLNLSVLHHPFAWIDRNIAAEFRSAIQENSDLIFTGHEHEAVSYQRKQAEGQSESYFEAGAFDQGDGSSKFRTVVVDLKMSTTQVTEFEWNAKNQIFDQSMSPAVNLPDSVQSNELGLVINQKFLKELTDPGMDIKHSLKRELELSDFFVFPRLIDDSRDIADASGLDVISSDSKFIDTCLSNKITVIVGDDKSGKTSLCRVGFQAAFSSGLLPVMVDATMLRSPSLVVLRNKIDDFIKTQYVGSNGIGELQNTDSVSVAFVDRFDHAPLSNSERRDLVKALCTLFTHVILAGDISLEVQLPENTPYISNSEDITRLQIAPLNSSQRKQLISNWFSIGNSVDSDNRDAKTHQNELYISTLIAEYGIPNFPMFILTYLQFADTERNLDLRISSNSKLLETLVDIGLSRCQNSSVPYQAKIAYLRDLAFHMHALGLACLRQDQINEFHTQYCARLEIEIDQSNIWKELCEAKILVLDEVLGGSFKYSYFRSFFVARYLSFFSSRTDVRNRICEIVDNIHTSENASVISTLSLYSSETWILERLKDQLSNILKHLETSGHRRLSEVVTEVTKLESFPLLESHVDESQPQEPERIPATNSEVADIGSAMAKAVRNMKVLGQLIRNSSNSLDGKLKRELVTTVLEAAGRLITVQINALEEEKDDIIAYLFARVRDKDPSLAEIDAKEEAKRRLLYLVFGSAIGLVDTVSRAVGDEFLNPTFRKIQEADTAKTFDFFLLGIKLDWYKSFPKTELIELFEETGGKGFSAAILGYLGFRSMVFRGNDLQTKVQQEVTSRLKLNFRRLQLRGLTVNKPTRIN